MTTDKPGLWQLQYRAKGQPAWRNSVMPPAPFWEINRELGERNRLRAYQDDMEHRMVPVEPDA